MVRADRGTALGDVVIDGSNESIGKMMSSFEVVDRLVYIPVEPVNRLGMLAC
jgi:hypothetical protein